jgi:phosphoribosylamine-glycine ligase
LQDRFPRHVIVWPVRVQGETAAAEVVNAISGFNAMAHKPDLLIVARGGRVLNVTATGATAKLAQTAAYAAVDKIDFPGGFCRRDIGWRAVE